MLCRPLPIGASSVFMLALLFTWAACGGQSDHPAGGSASSADQSGDAGGSSSGSGSSSSSSSSGGGTLPACSWPADMNPPDGGTGIPWSVARLYLDCGNGSGGGELCLSNDPTTCPGTDPVVGPPYTNCADQCASNQYAVAYGGPPPIEPDGGFRTYAQPPLPATCVGGAGLPSGAVIVCCPCDDPSAPHRLARPQIPRRGEPVPCGERFGAVPLDA